MPETPPRQRFTDFYVEQWPRLVAALSVVLPTGEDPEDVAQEAFARAFSRWSVVSSHPSPDGWLFLTGYRLATGIFRRLEIKRRSARPAERAEAADPFGETWVAEVLRSLPPKQRAVLVLRHYYGLSTLETASAMGCAEGTVKSLSFRARKALATQVSERGEGYA